MPCETFVTDDGHLATIVCSKRSLHRCVYCGRTSIALCDGPVPGVPGETCDKKLCRVHAHRPDPNRDEDFCPEHARALVTP